MTEDRTENGDELNFDDEEFIIEDLDGDDEDIFAEADLQMHPPPQVPKEGASEGPGDADLFDVEEDPDDFVIEDVDEVGGDASTPDVDDILFEALSERSETSDFNANLGANFSDQEAGQTAEIEQFDFDGAIGLGASSQGESADQPVEEEEDDALFALEDEDIEVIDGGMEFEDEASGQSQSGGDLGVFDETAAVPAGFNKYADPTAAEEDSILYAGSASAASLDDPESFAINEEEAEDDPIYGPQDESASEESASEEYAEEEAAYSSYEDEYIDNQAEHEAQLLGGGQGRRFPFSAAASLAAILMIAAAGAVVFLKPEWLGLKVEFEAIEVVQVARPDVDVDLNPPELPTVASTGPVEVSPPDIIEFPVIDPVDPGPDLPPIAVDPIPMVDPLVDPIDIDPIAIVDPTPPTHVMPVQTGPMQVGEFLSIDLAEAPTMIEPMVAGKRIDLALLQPGSEAFAELPNAAFFIGTVRKLNVSHVTLAVSSGEVTFAYDELVALTTLAEAGVALNGSSEAQQGYVRLDNHNRLYGMVVKSDESDKVLLESENSRVRIPMDAIDKIGIAIKGGVEIPDQEDDAWMQKQIKERMLRDRGQSQRFMPGSQTPKPGGK